MDVILLDYVEKLGAKDDLLKVKSGYARNFLIPQKLAVVANGTNLEKREGRLADQAKKEAEMLERIQEIVEKFNGAKISIGAKVGTTDKIFGSVTTYHLSEAIKAQLDIEVNRRKITIDGDIKTLGSYTANLDLHPDHQVELPFEVVAE